MLQEIEKFLHSLRPELWLIYHINMKAIQCGALVGISTFILTSNKKEKHTKNGENDKFAIDMFELRKHLFQSFIVTISMGICVTIYNLINLDDDILEDRVYRIINSNSQKHIDYSCIVGGLIGLGYSIKNIDSINNTTMNKTPSKEDGKYKIYDHYTPVFEYAIGNGLVGVGLGVLFHFIRTRGVVHPQRIWMYTSQCWQ